MKISHNSSYDSLLTPIDDFVHIPATQMPLFFSFILSQFDTFIFFIYDMNGSMYLLNSFKKSIAQQDIHLWCQPRQLNNDVTTNHVLNVHTLCGNLLRHDCVRLLFFTSFLVVANLNFGISFHTSIQRQGSLNDFLFVEPTDSFYCEFVCHIFYSYSY